MRDFSPGVIDFEGTSLYLAGSAAQGFYLHTDTFLDARDIDIVAVYERDIREECEYDKKAIHQEIGTDLNDGDEHEEEEEDVLCVYKRTLNVSDESHPVYLNVETWEDTYPGYVMLRKCRKNELPVQTSLKSRYVSSLETTRSRTDFWRNVKSYLEDEFHSILTHPRDKEEEVLITIHTQGPASSLTFSNMALHITIDADLVYALRYPKDRKQPQDTVLSEITRQWLERTPVSGWPSTSLKNEVVASGCLLVPKGHIGSRRQDYEWRISFSLGELKLARSLNRIQREVAHVLKALLYEEQYQFGHASINAKLDSYIILNILFTESETIKPEEWKEMNIAHILFHLLEKLASSIKTKNLPHYFVQKNNLLFKLLLDKVKLGNGEFKRGVSDEDILMDSDEYTDFAMYTVLRLRFDPLGQLLQQESYHRLPSALHRAVFEPFVKAAKASSKLDPIIYVSTLMRLAQAHLYMNNFNEANVYIENAETIFNKVDGIRHANNIKSDLLIIKAVCSYLVGKYDHALRLFEEINQNTQDIYTNFLSENQATFVAVFARVLSSKAVTDSPVSTQLKSKARRFLEKTVSGNSKPEIILELVNFFMLTGFYPEADELLMKIEDYIVAEEEDEPIEIDDEASRIYYGEAYAVPVEEEPIYVVHELDGNDQEMEGNSFECVTSEISGLQDKSGVTREIHEEERPVHCKQDFVGMLESSEAGRFVDKCTRSNLHEKEMNFDIQDMDIASSDFPLEPEPTVSDDQINIVEECRKVDSAPTVTVDKYSLTNKMKDQEEKSMLSVQFNSLDLTFNNEFEDPEYDNKLDSRGTTVDEQIFVNRLDSINEQMDAREERQVVDSASTFSVEKNSLTNEMGDQKEKSLLLNHFNSQDLTYNNEFEESEYENKLDIESDSDNEQTFVNRLDSIDEYIDAVEERQVVDSEPVVSVEKDLLANEMKVQEEKTMLSDHFNSRFDSIEEHFDFTSEGYYQTRPILNFHENQDLLNLCALARAFQDFGLQDEAGRIRNQISAKVQKRQKADTVLSVDALDHDLSVYMLNVEEAPIHNDWENPLYIFKEGIMFSSADRNILDDVLKALVHKCNVVTLSTNDLYFHYQIELAKYDGKTSGALDLVKHIRNENLKSIHYEILGDKQEAKISEWYASLRREKEPVYDKVSQWIKKLIDAVSRFEPRNVYLESVFK